MEMKILFVKNAMNIAFLAMVLQILIAQFVTFL